MDHLADSTKNFLDGAAVTSAIAAFFGVLPDLISLVTLIWVTVRLLETDTVKGLIASIRKKPNSDGQ